MNDRFKFRAWLTSAKKFTDRVRVYEDGSWGCYAKTIDGLYSVEADERESILIQCTGLKDKIGNLIFEGDIISFWDGAVYACNKSEDWDFHYPQTPPYFFKRKNNKLADVVYKPPSFGIKNGCPLGSKYLESENIEIIGNIYQNPELLEG